jgi:Leucine-rich repeat (LRR) protein
MTQELAKIWHDNYERMIKSLLESTITYLNTLPDDIEKINLHGKSLRELPNLSRFTNVKKLILSYNHLKQIPDYILSFKSLEILNLNGNELTSLPENLPSSLIEFHCDNNNLSNEIMEIIENNTTQEAISILVEKSLIYINNSYILK